ncbi:SMP-30/gluconolactonase/LRE family protein [Profundibacter sp.]|uniref:SMP-30/gluconolactonase/LRE family protein n=1 Tax=Profundibacter sp. TaxID=3101071 RepID=UPI003D134CA4
MTILPRQAGFWGIFRGSLKMVDAPSAEAGSGTKYELNSKLSQARSIGLGEVEGPEDVILDRNDNLYCGTRHGEVVRFFAPNYTEWEVFAHVGGFPLGLAFDKDENLISCVGAMGLYSISPDRKVTRLTAETRRSLTSIVDDAVLRDPNDLDIAPDGKIYFTDSTKRYDAHDWTLDSIENRGTGRLLVYNPEDGSTKTLLDGYHYTNGVTMVVSRVWWKFEDGVISGCIEATQPAAGTAKEITP